MTLFNKRSAQDLADLRRQSEEDCPRMINGNQVIRVNASDPASIINSGRASENEDNGEQSLVRILEEQ